MEELEVLNNEGGYGISFPEMAKQEARQQEWGEERGSSPRSCREERKCYELGLPVRNPGGEALHFLQDLEA